jgi:hypothetical protein
MELGLRTLTNLLLANATLLRCSNHVDIKLPDLILLQLDGEGVMQIGMTNQTGKVSRWHHEPVMCPQGALGWCLF